MNDPTKMGSRGGQAWTDEERDEAVKLYQSGASASVVAKRFGITRNAAIGRLCRAGAMGSVRSMRAKPSAPPPTRLPSAGGGDETHHPRQLGSQAPGAAMKPITPANSAPKRRGRPPKLRPVEDQSAYVRTVRVASNGNVYPMGELQPLPPERDESPGVCTVETLMPWSCRWPIGHPGTASFSFCGGRRVDGKPYCPDHCKAAYVAMPKKAPKSGNELARALRRFI